ncbi:MAG: hypothetical protein XU11_C0026G0008 [Candidatus Dadabacteria bacterium CSP1-2]|jgi:hypothetical protein|nr:MAG: hypothetical protein XU11_C0026G0008 [Candidatus Dadabacteria bacterium CSP1-2]
MKRILPLAIAFVVPILLFSFLGVFPGSASEEEDVDKMIETATTPEDHIKIAEYYEKQAKKMEEKARLHGTLADSYKNRGKPFSGLAKHCSDLSKKYMEAAKDYKTMAMEHMKMAQDMQKQ